MVHDLFRGLVDAERGYGYRECHDLATTMDGCGVTESESYVTLGERDLTTACLGFHRH